jgi:16S rRNA (guanine527-N7)-methyltransferase
MILIYNGSVGNGTAAGRTAECPNNNETKLREFNELLIEKNRVMNLTAHRTLAESWRKNILDSLLFREIFDCLDHAAVLDIGSGGGLPAVPLAVEFPNLTVTMTDSVNKKMEFLQTVIEKLQLKNAAAIHTRIEDFAAKNRERFDIVTAKAVAPLPTLLEYAMPLLKVGGRLYAFKGANYRNEIDKSTRALKLLGGVIEKVYEKELDGEITRCLLIIKKNEKTENKYPRQKNLPRTQPLL